MPITDGDIISVHYTGTLDDGTVFDSSRDREPLKFTMGKGQLISGFESAVMGREQGDVVTTHIPPEEAYGPVDEEMIFTVARAQLPQNIEASVGLPLTLESPEGERMDVTIVHVTDQDITLDANHPLAGKTLTFEIEIMGVN